MKLVERNIDHIIGAYLEGTIGSEDQKWLEEEMEKDEDLRLMVADIERTELIEKYVNEQLSAKERQAFEVRLTNEEELKNELAAFVRSNSLLELDRKLHYMEILQKLQAEEASDPQEKDKLRGIWWWLGGLGVLLILIVLFLIPKEDGLDTKSTSQTAIDTDSKLTPADSISSQDAITNPTIGDPGGITPPPQLPATPPTTLPNTVDSSSQDSIVNTQPKAIAMADLPRILDGIRFRDSVLINSAGAGREWENAIVQGRYDAAIQFLEQFFENSPASVANNPKQAYYLGILHLYNTPQNFERAAYFLELASLNINLVSKFETQSKDVRVHLMRSYLLANTPDLQQKADSLLSKYSELNEVMQYVPSDQK